MMDELELLKKDWQKKDEHLPKLSYDDIYKMLWKKSSSIVKWILIISILELIVPNLLYFFPSMREGFAMYKTSSFATYYLSLSIFYYGVVVYFIYQFYKGYKEISVLDNAKNLMGQIIKVRKTVKYYIIFCLSMTLLFFLVFVLGVYLDDKVLLSIDGIEEKRQEIPLNKLRTMTMWIIGIGGVVITALVGGIYFLLYGLLLRKLKRNYNELERLEV
jgi:hypothetical protein